jgi:hypothetical protein
MWRMRDGKNVDAIAIADVDGKRAEVNGVAYSIVLCGKRIPPMASMTRYLVTHEYGHAAFNHAARLLGYTDRMGDRPERDYLSVRGTEIAEGNRRWHQLASEIIANDFRTIVMRTEEDYWPHDVPRMGPTSAIAGWWQRAIDIAKVGKLPAPPAEVTP